MAAATRFKFNPSIVAIGITALCMGLIATLQRSQFAQIQAEVATISPAKVQQDIAAEQVRLEVLQNLPSALNFDNMLANWVFLQFLQYFGDDPARRISSYQLSPEFFEVVLDRDPRFLDAYFFLSGSTSLYAGMPKRTIALIDKGLPNLTPQVPPRSYYIWRYKGIDELLFLGDSQAARRSLLMAAQWAETYNDPLSQRDAALSRQMAEFLARNPNSRTVQVQAWAIVLNSAPDDRTRKLAIDRIRALGGSVELTPQGTLKITAPEVD